MSINDIVDAYCNIFNVQHHNYQEYADILWRIRIISHKKAEKLSNQEMQIRLLLELADIVNI